MGDLPENMSVVRGIPVEEEGAEPGCPPLQMGECGEAVAASARLSPTDYLPAHVYSGVESGLLQPVSFLVISQ